MTNTEKEKPVKLGGMQAHTRDLFNKGIGSEGTCSTAATTAAKTVTLGTTFELVSKATILVKFTNAISVANATLAVTHTDLDGNTVVENAKPIYYQGAALEAGLVKAGSILILRYDGTSYNIVGDLNTDTTYSTMGASGSTHAGGLVPDTPSTAGTTKFLREDATWQEVNASPEVQIGGTAPTSESEIKLFVDEDSDDTVEVYTKAQANILYAGKTDKVSGATNGNFAGLDANGNLVDSGKNANSFQLKVTDGASIGSGYGICETAATTAAKTATLANYLLLKNIPLSIYFQNGITVDNATLNINSQGAKPIFINGVALPAGVISAGTTTTMVYDGTNYNVIVIDNTAKMTNEYCVDMGLPSGVKWARCNIDTSSPNGFTASAFQYESSFFSWGNIDGHNPISTSAFSYTWNSSTYNGTAGSALTGNIPLSQDAARINLGYPWRIPSIVEFTELINNTSKVQSDGSTVITGTDPLVTVNGVVGVYLKSNINGNLLFLPCSGSGTNTSWNGRGTAGEYWTSDIVRQGMAYRVIIRSSGININDFSAGYIGMTIRPVQ